MLETILQWILKLVCNYIIRAFIALLHLIEAIVTMILTWVCTLIDIIITWFLCWTYIAEIFNNTRPRRFRVAPKIVRNNKGDSDWFVHVSNPNAAGAVDPNGTGYILSDTGVPLVPVVSDAGSIDYFEVETRGNFITGRLKVVEGHEGAFIPGRPFLYYPYKVMEIASHLFGDIFGSDPADDGRGTDVKNNLFTYRPNIQAWLANHGTLTKNLYNAWSGKYTSPGNANYFGDQTLSDMGMRVDTDSTCSHPTNTFLHLTSEIGFTPGNTAVAENMTCGTGETLTFDQTNFLMLNKDDASAVTTYFVSKFNIDDSQVGCNDVLGYTVVTFEGSDQPLFVVQKVLAFESDTNVMMSRIVENVSGINPNIVRVAETYLHECGHQCGLLHDSDKPDCENDTTLHIAMAMDPGGNIRRAYTRFKWCVITCSPYITSRSLEPFVQAPELPESNSVPQGPPK